MINIYLRMRKNDCYELLVNTEAKILSSKFQPNGQTPIHLAALYEHENIGFS